MRKSPTVVLIPLLSAFLLYGSLVQADVNRKDVLTLIRTIHGDFNQGTPDVWINDNVPDPSVNVGDTLSYAIASDTAQYFLLLLVDPKGSISVVFPDSLISSTPKKYRQFVYPPANTGILSQGEPVGTETVFAIAMEKPVTSSQLGFTDGSDIQSLANDEQAIEKFINTFNAQVANTSVSIVRYQYVVNADVQISSRAFRRELEARVQQVNVLEDNNAQKSADNGASEVAEAPVESEPLAVSDITFEPDSDTLTTIGRTQLDVFGSVLVNLWEDGNLPNITLEGHTDNVGEVAYNQRLSERRSDSTKRYLVYEYGLPAKNIATRGMGEAKPIASNATDALRAINRRVEIRVTQ